MRTRDGIALLDLLCALALLTIVLLPLTGVTVGTTKQVRGVDQRLVLQLHARRTHDELLTTTFEELAARPGATWTVNLGEPSSAAGYDEYLAGSKETTTVQELTPGLLSLQTVLEWPDLASGGTRRSEVIQRLMNNPTLSLTAREVLTEVEI